MSVDGLSDFKGAAKELMDRMDVLLQNLQPSATPGQSNIGHKELSVNVQGVQQSLQNTMQSVCSLPGADCLSQEQVLKLGTLQTQNTLKTQLIQKLATDQRLENVLVNSRIQQESKQKEQDNVKVNDIKREVGGSDGEAVGPASDDELMEQS